MKKITFRRILKQLKYDLIGKDSQRGITLTYGWLANQFGHFGLGFIPTVLFFILYSKYFPNITPQIWAPATTAIIWSCFEAYNFLAPLLKQSKTEVFSPDWKNVGFDTFCDLIFFYLGASVAGFIYTPNVIFASISVVLMVGTFGIFLFWYPIKMYSQYALFPFQYRLSQWCGNISDIDKQTILQMLKTASNTHILLFGGENSGKTSLAISVSTEFTIKRHVAWYTTAIKSSLLFAQSNEDFKVKHALDWSWRNADILVIDDINTGSQQSELIYPEYFNQIITTSPYAHENLSALQNQSVIWVAGNEYFKQEWKEFLIRLGIDERKIVEIVL